MAVQPERGGSEQAGSGSPTLGSDHGFQHRHEIPARGPQHRGEPEGERQRRGQRLAHGRHLTLAQIRHAGRGRKQLCGVDPPVGLEDHRFGRGRGSRHRFGEAPGRQGIAPGRDQPRPSAAAAERAHGHVERAFELEPGIEQIGDGLETIDPRLAAHDEEAQKPQPRQGWRIRTVHRGSPAEDEPARPASINPGLIGSARLAWLEIRVRRTRP